MRVTKGILVRSALVGLFLTMEGIGLQVATARLILHSGPPPSGHIVGVTVCYIVAGFTFALGFFLLRERLPGRTGIRKGLRYSAVILTAVWISGFINLCAIDFDGGWNLLSRAKIANYWMALVDCLNFMIGGLVLGLMARHDGQVAPVAAPFTPNLAATTCPGSGQRSSTSSSLHRWPYPVREPRSFTMP